MINAEVIADSIHCVNQSRIITVKFDLPTCVLAEFNTHGMLARNVSSSRAIPFHKMIDRVRGNKYTPQFRKEQPGMQAGDLIQKQTDAKHIWDLAHQQAEFRATELVDLGVHKQVANRLLGAFMHSTVVATGSGEAWANFFFLRTHHKSPMSDFAIAPSAEAIRLVVKASKPQVLNIGEWHLPFTSETDGAGDSPTYGAVGDRIIISVARCARTSYDNFKENTFENDKALHDRLLTSDPKHASPAEHQALCVDPVSEHNNKRLPVGWVPYRSYIEGEYFTDLEEALSW